MWYQKVPDFLEEKSWIHESTKVYNMLLQSFLIGIEKFRVYFTEIFLTSDLQRS